LRNLFRIKLKENNKMSQALVHIYATNYRKPNKRVVDSLYVTEL